MDDASPSGRRWIRIVLVVVLGAAVVAAAAIHALWPRGPRTDVEAVARVHADLTEAFVEGDHDRVWDLLSSDTKSLVDQGLHTWRDPATARRMGTTTEEYLGISPAELAAMDARAFMVTGFERYAERHPDVRAEEVRRLRALTIRRVRMTDEGAEVTCDGKAWRNVAHGPRRYPGGGELTFKYRREDGEWRFDRLEGRPVMAFFPPLERKLPCPLPKGREWDERPVAAVVSIGPEGLASEGAKLLTERLEALLEAPREGLVVVLDVAPRVSIQGAIRAEEAIRATGVGTVWYAAADPDGPHSGARVNGVPLGRTAVAAPPRSVLERVIRVKGPR